MSAVYNDESKNEVLAAILASSRITNARFMLGTTLAAIDHDTPYATFAAVEAAWTGYARQVLSGWTTPVLSGLYSISLAAMVTISNSSGSTSPTITWWAIVDNTASKIVQAGLYPAPFTIPDSDVYRTTPVLTFKGEINSLPI